MRKPIFFFLTLTAALAASAHENSTVSITVVGNKRIIRSNGLPDHATGLFPNKGNPNKIREQTYLFSVPAKPKAAASITPLGMHPFGVAVNGVVFDPSAAEWWNDDPSSGWRYEGLGASKDLGMDGNNAHVQPNGAYHYHGLPQGLTEKLGSSALVGWAADGFPIYGGDAFKSSYRLKQGPRSGGPGGTYDGSFVEDYEYAAGAGDLDECNGRVGSSSDFPEGTYQYVVTREFPFIPRCFKGAPDRSFLRPGGAGRGGSKMQFAPSGEGPAGTGQRRGPPPFGRPPPRGGPPPKGGPPPGPQ